ncbi:MAG: HIT domain-containing protein [candidate division Zixibacteria bacterium]|nr:HIT domain-containing protein [candidate division Zixibacteria bacterium]
MATIFTQIINRERPAKIFYEDEQVIVIADHRPQAPVHLLLIPKKESPNFYETDCETLDLLNKTAKKVAEKLGISNHFQLRINNGLGQEIDHIHYHFLSNRGREKLKFIDS